MGWTPRTREEALAEVSRHCDLKERLQLVPPSAAIRGVYVRNNETALARENRLEPYRAIFPERFSPLSWVSYTDFLPRLVVAGALLRGPERVHEGMFEIGRGNAQAFTETALGRVMLRLLAREPKRVLQQAVAGRRQSARPSHWTLEFPDPRKAVMSIAEEYSYYESYLLGAAQGTVSACAVPVKVSLVVFDRFSGQHVFEW